jgi:DNA-binding response OmpR family regulator
LPEVSSLENWSIPMKMLVVDDNHRLCLLYSEEFEEEGYSVRTAENAKKALGMIDKERSDIVILDIMMPGMDGVEALSKIMAKDKTIKIVLNTAFSTFKDNFMTWMADAYVVKSGDLTELKEKVRSLLVKKEHKEEKEATAMA